MALAVKPPIKSGLNWRLFSLIGALLILLVLGILFWSHHFPFSRHKNVVTTLPTGGQATKGAPNDSSLPNGQSTSNQDASGLAQDNKSIDNGSSTTLISPANSTFVSNHHTSLSANAGQSSVCNTSVGATCQISFTNGNTTKQLEAQVADRSGAVYWSWKPQDIGLSVGSWTIIATAHLNGQSATAQDALNLEVTP